MSKRELESIRDTLERRISSHRTPILSNTVSRPIIRLTAARWACSLHTNQRYRVRATVLQAFQTDGRPKDVICSKRLSHTHKQPRKEVGSWVRRHMSMQLLTCVFPPVQGRRDRWIRFEEPYACLSLLQYLHQFKHALWKSTQSQAVSHTPLVVFGPPTWCHWIDNLPSSSGLLTSIATWFINSLCALHVLPHKESHILRSIIFTFGFTHATEQHWHIVKPLNYQYQSSQAQLH